MERKRFEKRPRGQRKRKFSRGPRGKDPGARRRKQRSLEPMVRPESLERGPKARFEALKILVEADNGSRFIDQVLEERLNGGKIQQEDKHLVQEIAFGAVRHRSTIDQILDNYIQFSMKRQHVDVRWALRLAAYQLIYLSRIPSHAAIHGSIEALKGINGIQASDVGFVNAVLRRVHNDILEKTEEEPPDLNAPTVVPARHGWCHFKRPVLPPCSVNRTLHMALKFSHPRWLMSRWIARFGEDETIALCMANNRVPRVTAIITGAAPSRDEVAAALESAGVVVEPGITPESLRLRKTGDVRHLLPFARGWIRIQDETAKAIGDALAPPAGGRVLDLCAAPGGKAAQLLEQIGDKGHLVACDIDNEKLARLRENLERVGKNFTAVMIPEAPEKLPTDESYSHILVDVPCSNTGVLARRPEARWRIHGEDLSRLAALQGRILTAALRILKPGGRLVYSTCSIEPEENGRVVAAARQRHPGLSEVASRLFLPHRDGADGGYYAILEAPLEKWPPA